MSKSIRSMVFTPRVSDPLSLLLLLVEIFVCYGIIPGGDDRKECLLAFLLEPVKLHDFLIG